MSINIKTQKILSPSNVKKIIELGISLKDSLDVVNQKCVEEYDETRTYAPNMLCIYNGYIWKCKFTTTGVFSENKWEKLSDDLSLIDLDTIKNMVNLTDEEITNLQSLISTEIRLDKVFSSSDVYNRILNATNECKKFTLEQLAKKAGVVYKIVDNTTGVDSTEYLYLISNGSGGYNIYAYIDSSAVKISDTNINLDGYAKLTDLDDYLKKTDADGKYATITTVDGKIDKSSILSAISSTPSDDKLLSEKAINDTLVKKTDITTTIDSSSTDTQVPSAKSVWDNIQNKNTMQPSGTMAKYSTVFDWAVNNAGATCPYEGNNLADCPLKNTWGTLVCIGIKTENGLKVLACSNFNENIYIRTILRRNGTNEWVEPNWKRVCSTSVADVVSTSVPLPSTMGGSIIYRVKNGICYVSAWGVGATVKGDIIISTSMPKSAISSAVDIYNHGSDSICGMLFIEETTTNLVFRCTNINNGGFASLSYPVAEQ